MGVAGRIESRLPLCTELIWETDEKVPLTAEEHVEVTDDIEPELEKLLHTDTSQGLSDGEAEERLAKFGPNGETIIAKWARRVVSLLTSQKPLQWINRNA